MRWTVLAVAGCLLLFSARQLAQGQYCSECSGATCAGRAGIGKCICFIDGHQCLPCELCYFGTCRQPCLAPSDEKNTSPNNTNPNQTSNILQLPAATAEQVKAHPWLLDPTLAQKVSALSPELGDFIAAEQKNLKSHWAPEFRGGTGLLDPNNPKTGYKWELITHKNADEYRIKRDADNTEKRIVLGRDIWVVSSGDDYSQFVGSGQITKP